MTETPKSESGWAVWQALERTPLRFTGRGVVLGLDWAGALALAQAFGAGADDAADLLAAGEDGLLEALKQTDAEQI